MMSSSNSKKQEKKEKVKMGKFMLQSLAVFGLLLSVIMISGGKYERFEFLALVVTVVWLGSSIKYKLDLILLEAKRSLGLFSLMMFSFLLVLTTICTSFDSYVPPPEHYSDAVYIVFCLFILVDVIGVIYQTITRRRIVQ